MRPAGERIATTKPLLNIGTARKFEVCTERKPPLLLPARRRRNRGLKLSATVVFVFRGAQILKVRNFAIILRPFLALFPALCRLARAVFHALLCAHAGRVLIDACNPMVCPICSFRPSGVAD